MPLNMPDGAACFIDANILYYHFVETPPLSQACTLFLERVAAGAIAGYSSVHVLAEAAHKIMLAEAAASFNLNRAGLVNWLQHHRDHITRLHQFQQAVDEFLDMNLSMLIADPTILREAARLPRERGLLTNDATVLALIRRQGLSHLASNDDDFDDIPGLTVWKPR